MGSASGGGSGLFAAGWAVVAVLFAACAGGSVLYLLTLLCAALLPPRRFPPAQTETPLRFAVVVPAHDEELVIDATLQSLQNQDYPTSLVEFVVVADNCSDTTAFLARKRGVTVLERSNPDERGKGYALQWAFAQLLSRTHPADAFVVVDADTWVAPDFLTVMAAALAARKNERGMAALQGRYGVLNDSENWRTALMAGAFALFNHVKPLGRDRFHLSVGLKGNGMAFTREVMQAAPWQGTSITEDIDYGLDLLHHGVRVGYVPDALVRAQMPTTAKQAASQRERWEGGRTKLLQNRVLPLAKQAIQKRDLAFADAAFDLLVPPLAELAALLAAWGVWVLVGAKLHLTAHSAGWATVWALASVGFAVYVLGGFKAAGAPREAYSALFRAPGYAVWKIMLMLARPLRRRKTTNAAAQNTGDEWVRTERTPLSAAAPPPQAKDAAP